ncbi:MAG: hypothetical protein H0X11_01495 [Betaproteobacteria bacterium]|nr:hypothetical protein [Betaproteobacteria bacterium]
MTRSGDNLRKSVRRTISADAKVAKTVRGAKQGEADIVNIGKACDKAARRFSSAFVQGISGTGH